MRSVASGGRDQISCVASTRGASSSANTVACPSLSSAYPPWQYLLAVRHHRRVRNIAGDLLKRGGSEALHVTSPACRIVVDDRDIGAESDMVDVARGLTTHQLVKHVAAHRFWIARGACVLGQSERILEKHLTYDCGRAQRAVRFRFNLDSTASRTGTFGGFLT